MPSRSIATMNCRWYCGSGFTCDNFDAPAASTSSVGSMLWDQGRCLSNVLLVPIPERTLCLRR